MQREATGLSQRELAKKLSEFGFNIQQSAIAKIENGTRPLRVSELVAIAHALGVPWQTLVIAGENYASFSRDPVARLQERIDADHLLAEQMMKEEIESIKQFLEGYTDLLGGVKAAQQLWGRIKLTDPKEIADAIAEILDNKTDGSERTETK